MPNGYPIVPTDILIFSVYAYKNINMQNMLYCNKNIESMINILNPLDSTKYNV